ncbi:MAG: amidohydrolase family protein, partial [Candidatus Eisenbacteria bacterium]
ATEELSLSLSRLWPATDEEMDEAVLFAQDEAFRNGVIWVHEMGDAAGWAALQRASRAGRLRLWVSQFFRCEGRDALRTLSSFVPPKEAPYLSFAGIKLFLDGSIGARTAAVREPYPGGEPTYGTLVWEDRDLDEALRICIRNDWKVAAHAIGDRALEQFVSALERTDYPPNSTPRVEHAEMLPDDLYERSVRRGVLFSMQPNFTANWQGPGGLYEQTLGPERARALNPFAKVDPSRLLFGSDHMPLDPRYGIQGAMGHPDPEQRLSRAAALDAYTEVHFRSTWSHFGGLIDSAQPASFVIVSDDGAGTDILATTEFGKLAYLAEGSA